MKRHKAGHPRFHILVKSLSLYAVSVQLQKYIKRIRSCYDQVCYCTARDNYTQLRNTLYTLARYSLTAGSKYLAAQTNYTQKEACSVLKEQMHDIHALKSHDYANSKEVFRNLMLCEREKVCPAWKGVIIRLGDKVSRIRNFSTGNPYRVKQETFLDTAIDLANYSLIAIILLEEFMHLSSTQKAYYAALLDGEGSICCHGGKVITVTISNTNKKSLMLFHYKFGGSLLSYRHTRQSHYKTAWLNSISGYSAYTFLKQVLPYLIIKKDKAQNALKTLSYCKNDIPGKRSYKRQGKEGKNATEKEKRKKR